MQLVEYTDNVDIQMMPMESMMKLPDGIRRDDVHAEYIQIGVVHFSEATSMKQVTVRLVQHKIARIALSSLRTWLRNASGDAQPLSAFILAGALVIGTTAAPTTVDATTIIQVGHGVCGSSFCAENTSGFLPTASYASFGDGELIAGAEANANFVKAYLANTILGGSGTILVGHSDEFTLTGPGSSTISFTATVHVTGTRNARNATGATAGFMSPGLGSHLSPPGSVGGALGGGVGDLVFDTDVTQTFTAAPGEVFDVAMGISAITTNGGTIDFSSTLTLGFFDLPTGYYVSSRDGFSGAGSGKLTSVPVPEPATLTLLTLGLAGIGLSRRKTTH